MGLSFFAATSFILVILMSKSVQSQEIPSLPNPKNPETYTSQYKYLTPGLDYEDGHVLFVLDKQGIQDSDIESYTNGEIDKFSLKNILHYYNKYSTSKIGKYSGYVCGKDIIDVQGDPSKYKMEQLVMEIFKQKFTSYSGFSGGVAKGLNGGSTANGDGIAWIPEYIERINAYNLTKSANEVNIGIVDYDYNSHDKQVSSIIRDSDSHVGVTKDARLLSFPLPHYKTTISISEIIEDPYLITEICDAASQGSKVINISLGSLHDSIIVQGAIKDAINTGVTVIAAGGNTNFCNTKTNEQSFYSFCGTRKNKPMFPAAKNGDLLNIASDRNDGLISVGAINATGKLASWATRQGYYDLLAPGTLIKVRSTPFSVTLAAGSSFAAPFVSAAAALLLSSRYNDKTPIGIESRLKETATKTVMDDNTYLLNVGDALPKP